MSKKLFASIILCLTMAVSLLAFTACKEDAVFKVNFQNGSEVQTVDVVDGVKVQKPADPTKSGYDFVGWFVGESEFSFEQAITGDITLTAKFTPKQYSITYDLLGGVVANANPTSYTIETETFTLTNPTKDYYDFAGWVVDGSSANLVAKVNKGSMGNLTFTATYTPISYPITYVLNGGIVSNPASYTVEQGVTLSNPVKPGYEFIGWTYAGQTEPVKFVSLPAGTHGALEFTANFDITNVNLTYDLKNGTVTTANPESITVNTDTFTLTNPTRIGSEFIGWTWEGQTEPVLEVTIEKGSLLVDREFVANYSISTYNIGYVLNGGTIVGTNPATYNVETETFTLINPTKPDYVFLGWTYDGQATPIDTVTIEKGSIAKNLEFTANFESVFTIGEDGYINGISQKALTLSVINVPQEIDGEMVMGVNGSVLNAITNVTEFTTTHSYMKVVDGNLYSIDGSMLYRYAPAKEGASFTLPEGCTSVSAYAFANATNLTEVIIPSEVEVVGANIFAGTTNIVAKVESSEASANYDNNWATGAKDVIYDYLTGDDDDNIVGF